MSSGYDRACRVEGPKSTVYGLAPVRKAAADVPDRARGTGSMRGIARALKLKTHSRAAAAATHTTRDQVQSREKPQGRPSRERVRQGERRVRAKGTSNDSGV